MTVTSRDAVTTKERRDERTGMMSGTQPAVMLGSGPVDTVDEIAAPPNGQRGKTGSSPRSLTGDTPTTTINSDTGPGKASSEKTTEEEEHNLQQQQHESENGGDRVNSGKSQQNASVGTGNKSKPATQRRRGPAPPTGSLSARQKKRGHAKDAAPSMDRTLIDREELKLAFQFFDMDGKGYITRHDLKKRLGVFYNNLSTKEYVFLMNNQQELTEGDLYALLSSTDLTDYDPVAEAFKVYDPKGTGYVDMDTFREILRNLGFSNVSDQDVRTLINNADRDKDGKVSLNDFRHMLEESEEEKQQQDR